MAKVFALLACLSVVIALAAAQFGLYNLPSLVRDARQNQGPVLFPPNGAGSSETSGVRVGASGFGFVPPGAQRTPQSGFYSFF